MDKIFLVITSSRSTSTKWADREKYVHEFYSELEDKLKDTKVLYTTYDEIICVACEGEVSIYDSKHKIDLKDVNVVHFKNWMFDYEYAALIANYLNFHNVIYFNSEVNAGLAWGKIAQMCRLGLSGLPVPNSYFAKRKQLMTQLKSGLPEGLKYPLIIKADDGSKGNDNYLATSQKEAINILAAAKEDKEFIVQNFHPNDGDYRFLYIGLDDEPLVFLRKGVEGSHLNNTSRGGQGTIVKAKDLPKEYLEIARQAAQVMNREICGVDILIDKDTKKPYILEVNSTPALATGYVVELKNEKFAKFLQNIIEALEEE